MSVNATNVAATMDEEVGNDLSPDLAKCAKREVRAGFLTGAWTPGRLSTPVCSIVLTSANC